MGLKRVEMGCGSSGRSGIEIDRIDKIDKIFLIMWHAQTCWFFTVLRGGSPIIKAALWNPYRVLTKGCGAIPRVRFATLGYGV